MVDSGYERAALGAALTGARGLDSGYKAGRRKQCADMPR